MPQGVGGQPAAEVPEIGVGERFRAQPCESTGIVKHHGHAVVKLRDKLIGLGGDHRESVIFPQTGEEKGRALFHREKDLAPRSGRAEAGLEVAGGRNEAATLADGVPPGKARELVIAGVGHGFEDALALHALDGNGDAPRLCGEDARAPRLNDDGRDVFRVDVLGKLR